MFVDAHVFYEENVQQHAIVGLMRVDDTNSFQRGAPRAQHARVHRSRAASIAAICSFMPATKSRSNMKLNSRQCSSTLGPPRAVNPATVLMVHCHSDAA